LSKGENIPLEISWRSLVHILEQVFKDWFALKTARGLARELGVVEGQVEGRRLGVRDVEKGTWKLRIEVRELRVIAIFKEDSRASEGRI
jgi:hypothetical protein